MLFIYFFFFGRVRCKLTREFSILREQIGDPTGEATAQMNLADLRRTLGVDGDGADGLGSSSAAVGGGMEADDDGLYGADGKARHRRLSMERMDLLKVRPRPLFLPLSHLSFFFLTRLTSNYPYLLFGSSMRPPSFSFWSNFFVQF